MYSPDMDRKTLHASLYLRISVTREESDSIARQKHDLLQMAAHEGFVVAEIRIDDGVSGSATNRPAYQEWLADAVSGRADVLLAWRFDRITRGGLPALASLLDVLQRSGARLMTYGDRMDSASGAFRITAAVISEIAHAERESIRARVESRQAADRRAGIWTKSRPFGYLVEGGKLVQEPREARIVRDLLSKVEGGASLRSLAGWLDERKVPTPRTLKGYRTREGARWGMTSVRAILTNPALAGYYPHNRQPARDEQGEHVIVSHDPILSPGEWARLSLTLAGRSAMTPNGQLRPAVGRPPAHSLSGLVKCQCGGALVYSRGTGGSQPRFQCQRQRHNARACAGLSMLAEKLEDRVIHAVVSRVASLEPGSPEFEAVATRWLRRLDPIETAERTAATDAVAGAEAVVADLEAARYERGEFPGGDGVTRWQRLYDRAIARLNGAREALTEFPAQTDIGGLLEPETFAMALGSGDITDRRALFRIVLDEIVLTKADGHSIKVTPKWAAP